MIEKRLTVILYGCDRNLWRGGPLQIRVTDVFASGGPRPLYQGEDGGVHTGASPGAALRRRSGVRVHLLRPASSSCMAARSPAGFHPGAGARSKATT